MSDRTYVVYSPVEEGRDKSQILMYIKYPFPEHIVPNGVYFDGPIPNAEEIPGMRPIMMIDLTQQQVYYDYEAYTPPPLPPTTDEEIALLKAQNLALSERADFVEDVIAQIAIKV